MLHSVATGRGGDAGVVSREPMAALRHYKFVDYATQGYTALVAVLVLLFHTGAVPRWQWIFTVHIALLVLIHSLILWDRHLAGTPAKARPPTRLSATINFLRHFYPVLLYTWFFSSTGWMNRMFFREFMDPTIIRWEQALFGCQP